MIHCIISAFMHSVVLANPTEQTVGNEGNIDGTAKDSNNADADSEDNNSPKHGNKEFSFSPTKDSSSGDEKSDDSRDSRNTFDLHQDDMPQPSSTLPASNLTLDAISIRDEKMPAEHQQKVKQPKWKESKHEKEDDLDMKEFIKQIVYKKYGDAPTVKFFDAAIVYDEEDYSAALSFRDEIKRMLQLYSTDDVRVELFDSEQFTQSKILVVKDVIDKCSVVLLYLTEHFISPELNLFVEESIAMTRFGNNQRSSEGSHQNFTLIPVHTEPKSHRKYQVPVGLLSMKGINWFDKSFHTRDQIISLIKTARAKRKQREASGIADFAYQSTFGLKSELPAQFEAPSFLEVTMPPEETHVQQMPNDSFSFLRPRTPPEHVHMFVPQHCHHNEISSTQDQRLADNMIRYNVPSDGLQHGPYGMKQVGNYNVPDMQYNLTRTPRFQNTDPLEQMTQPHFQNMGMISPYDSRYIPCDEYLQQNSFQQQNVQDARAHYTSIPTHDAEPSSEFHLHEQHNYHQRHFGEANTQLPYSGDQSSRNAASGLSNTTYNTPNVTTNYTSNLSTDDVEIDNPVEAKDESKSHKSDASQHARKSRGKGKKQNRADIMESESDSDSSDDEYTISVPAPKRSRHKVINITGCSVVQLGKGNTVSQPSNSMATIQKPSQRSKTEPQIYTRKETVKRFNNVDQCSSNSVSEDNLSFTNISAHTFNDTNHLNIPNDPKNLLTGDDTNNIAEDLMYSKRNVHGFGAGLGRSKTNTKLNVVVNTNNMAKHCEDTANHSPDNNDDELFISGPLVNQDHSPISNQEGVMAAPFTFSRTRQFPQILKHGVSAYKTSNPSTEINDGNELD